MAIISPITQEQHRSSFVWLFSASKNNPTLYIFVFLIGRPFCYIAVQEVFQAWETSLFVCVCVYMRRLTPSKLLRIKFPQVAYKTLRAAIKNRLKGAVKFKECMSKTKPWVSCRRASGTTVVCSNCAVFSGQSSCHPRLGHLHGAANGDGLFNELQTEWGSCSFLLI